MPTARKGESQARVKAHVIPALILLLDRFTPDVLLIPKTGKSNTRRSKHSILALEAMVAEAYRRSIPVYAFSDHDVRNAFRDTEGKPATNKAAIDQLIAERHPALKRSLPRPRRRWDPEAYYRPLFNAVALHGAWLDLLERDQ